MQDGWLAWALDPEAPIAVSIFREGYKKGLAWFPSRPLNCVSLVKALCRVWAKQDRDAFPTIVEWANSPEWMSLEEQTIRAERHALSSELEGITPELQGEVGTHRPPVIRSEGRG